MLQPLRVTCRTFHATRSKLKLRVSHHAMRGLHIFARLYSNPPRLSSFDVAALKTATPKPEPSKTNRFAKQFEQRQTKVREPQRGSKPREAQRSPKFSDRPRTAPSNSSYSGSSGPPRRQMSDYWRQSGEPPRANHRSEPQPYRRRQQDFEVPDGSPKMQEALMAIMLKCRQNDSRMQVRFVDPSTQKMTEMHLQSVINLLDVETDGLTYIPPSRRGELPIVRINKVSDMIRVYSDELAEAKRLEILKSGSFHAKRTELLKAQAERKKASTKMILLSWAITVPDLLNQKRTEILGRLKKDEKLLIYWGDKRTHYSVRKGSEKEDGVLKLLQKGESLEVIPSSSGEDVPVEIRRREMLLLKLQNLLEENECKVVTTGSLESRVILSVTGKKPVAEKGDLHSQTSPKEARRLEKARKASEANSKEKKTDEEDLDSLYLFKID